MHNYLSTFIPGTFPIIERELKKLYPGTQILSADESLMTYKSEAEPSDIKQLRLFNNSFILVKSLSNMGKNPIKTLVNQATQDRALVRMLTQYTKGKSRSVRVMFYEDNEGVNIPTPIRENIEKYIAKERTLWINRRIADIEVWFTTRSNNTGFIGIRLTSFPTGEKSLEPGQLKPQLAHLLCLLSEPNSQDKVLDPFAGYGSIPLERTYFKYQEIIASDSEPKTVEQLQQKVKDQNKKITVIQQDAGSLDHIQDSSVDKIITDPPWGLFEKHIDIPTLYELFLKQAARVLKPNGILVILTAQKEILEKLLAQENSLKLEEKYDILVSGKKAGIYKITKD